MHNGSRMLKPEFVLIDRVFQIVVQCSMRPKIQGEWAMHACIQESKCLLWACEPLYFKLNDFLFACNLNRPGIMLAYVERREPSYNLYANTMSYAPIMGRVGNRKIDEYNYYQ